MIIVEGTIGAGKSTFLKMLQQYLSEHTIVLEPLEQWNQEHEGASLLSLFYKNPERWAYAMELMTLMSRVRDYKHYRAHFGEHIIVERSVFSGRYCFAHNSFASGYLTELEWRMYEQWFDFLITQHAIQPRAFIYLRVSPEKAYERMIKRGRAGEVIPLDYLERIGDLHDQFLVQKNNVPAYLKNVPILCLDGESEFEASGHQFSQHVEQIRTFIKEL